MSGSFQAALFIVVTPLILGTSKPAPAQPYQVGIPVCDTILAGSESGACAPYDVLLFGLGPSLIPYVTGLNFQIVITETNGRIWSDMSDTLKVGDTLTIPAIIDSGVKVFFAINSYFKFITRIVGTPTVPYENYHCETTYSHTTMTCGNTLAYHGAGPICQVQPAASVEEKGDASIPIQFQLLQNYPNPFNAATIIQFDLARSSEVSLQIFNLHGKEVTTLINQKKLAAGNHKITWNAEDLPSGVYVCRLQSGGDFVAMRRLVLLK